MQVGIHCHQRGNQSLEECNRCSLNEHPCEMPTQIIQIILRDSVKRHVKEGTFSVTGLLGCPRKTVLQGETDYYEDMEGSWKKLRGTMVHALLEKEGVDYPGSLLTIREERFSIPIETKYGTQEFSGKPDEVVIFSVDQGVARVGIWDWKTTSEITHSMVSPYDDNRKQMNMYSYLVTKALPAWLHNKLLSSWYTKDTYRTLSSVNSVKVVYMELFYGDMKKGRRFNNTDTLTTKGKMTKRTYPQEWEELELNMLENRSTERTEKFIRGRIEEILGAKEVLPPILEGDDAKFCPYCPVKDVCYSLHEKENGNG